MRMLDAQETVAASENFRGHVKEGIKSYLIIKLVCCFRSKSEISFVRGGREKNVRPGNLNHDFIIVKVQ